MSYNKNRGLLEAKHYTDHSFFLVDLRDEKHAGAPQLMVDLSHKHHQVMNSPAGITQLHTR